MLIIGLGRPLAWKLLFYDLGLANTLLLSKSLGRVAASSDIMGFVSLMLHRLLAQVDSLLLWVNLVITDY